jgi:predicted metalloprotease with PDZ domain
MQHKTAFALIVLFFFGLLVSAQDYVFTMIWLEPHTHTYRITAEVLPQTKGYTDFRMPSWRPGRYRLQNYSAAVTGAAAVDEKGNPLKLEKVDKDTWRVRHGILDKVRFTYDNVSFG